MEPDLLNMTVKDLVAKEGFRAFSMNGSSIFPYKHTSKEHYDEAKIFYIYLVERNYKHRKENPTKFGVQIPYDITKEQLEDKIKTSAQKYREHLSSTKRKGV